MVNRKPDPGGDMQARIITSIEEVSPNEWDSCAGRENPFTSHAFLTALEKSGSVSANTGWLPQHILVQGENKNIMGCMPLYLKSHSYGEYIFDWGWAEAFENAGGKYYPKLQAAIPFTPATGKRLLLHPDAKQSDVDRLVHSMKQLSSEHKVSSLHVTFLDKTQWSLLGKSGFLLRTNTQFHWENRGYKNFEQFLGELNSRKRKAIKKERRKIIDQGITIKVLNGREITEEHWDLFYSYYIDTIGKKWGRAYLTREFFSLLGEQMANLAVLIIAEHQGRKVAGALNLLGDNCIYGRNWGCLEDFQFLHFEACYYQAIEYAIEHNLQWVEAGAQGPHKIQRGYLPREVYSAHWIENPAFKDAIALYLEKERQQTSAEIKQLMRFSPYREDINKQNTPKVV